MKQHIVALSHTLILGAKLYKSVEEKGRGPETKKWTKSTFTNSALPLDSGFNCTATTFCQ